MPWELWRQDDHGNEVLVRVFEHRGDAERARDEFIARGHHQHYWLVEHRPARRRSPGSGTEGTTDAAAVEELRRSIAAWLDDAAHQLRADYPAAHVQADVSETEAFALRAHLAITTGDPAVATEDVVVSVDVKRGEDAVTADVARGTGEVLDLYETQGLDADAVARIHAFLAGALDTVRNQLA